MGVAKTNPNRVVLVHAPTLSTVFCPMNPNVCLLNAPKIIIATLYMVSVFPTVMLFTPMATTITTQEPIDVKNVLMGNRGIRFLKCVSALNAPMNIV
jgi:hypothetical protein